MWLHAQHTWFWIFAARSDELVAAAHDRVHEHVVFVAQLSVEPLVHGVQEGIGRVLFWAAVATKLDVDGDRGLPLGHAAAAELTCRETVTRNADVACARSVNVHASAYLQAIERQPILRPPVESQQPAAPSSLRSRELESERAITTAHAHEDRGRVVIIYRTGSPVPSVARWEKTLDCLSKHKKWQALMSLCTCSKASIMHAGTKAALAGWHTPINTGHHDLSHQYVYQAAHILFPESHLHSLFLLNLLCYCTVIIM